MRIKQNNISAFDAALNFITFKDRTKQEIEIKLKEKMYSLEEIDLAIDKLLEYKYIDDSNYTNRYIKSNIDKKGVSRITNELINKGVSREIISEELSKFDFCEEDAITNEIIRKYGTEKFDDKQKSKIIGYFARRGFKYNDISRALSRACE